MWEAHSFGGGFMWIFWIFLIVAAVWLIGFAVKSGAGDNRKEKTALEILEERFARGEIDAEEFESKRKSLGG